MISGLFYRGSWRSAVVERVIVLLQLDIIKARSDHVSTVDGVRMSNENIDFPAGLSLKYIAGPSDVGTPSRLQKIVRG